MEASQRGVKIAVRIARSTVLGALLMGSFPAFAQIKNLEGYWTFDSGRDAEDKSRNERHGELTSGVELTENEGAPIPDAPKGCVTFPGVKGDMVDCGVGPKLRTGVTLMAWAEPEEVAAVQFIAGTPYSDGVAWNDPWIAYQIGVRRGQMTTSLNIRVGDQDKWLAREYNAGVAIAAEWHHYCFTFSDETSISYIDGAEVANFDNMRGEIGFEGDPHFVIGERSATASGHPFRGRIDEVALYSRALTPKEIQAVMNGGVELGIEPQGKAATMWGYMKVKP